MAQDKNEVSGQSEAGGEKPSGGGPSEHTPAWVSSEHSERVPPSQRSNCSEEGMANGAQSLPSPGMSSGEDILAQHMENNGNINVYQKSQV